MRKVRKVRHKTKLIFVVYKNCLEATEIKNEIKYLEKNKLE